MARFDTGYIKFYRRAVNEDIGWSGVQLAVWVTLLCWATRFETKIRWTGGQRTIPPGSVVTATRELSARLGFSKDAIARALRSLAERESIRIEGATRGTLITICNWAEYQESSEEPPTPSRHECDNDRTLDGRQPDLNGEVKKKRSNIVQSKDFDLETAYQNYPRKQGRTHGLRRLRSQIKTDDDYRALLLAIENYRNSPDVQRGYVKIFSSFVSEWRDWTDPETGQNHSVPSLPGINTIPLKIEEIQ